MTVPLNTAAFRSQFAASGLSMRQLATLTGLNRRCLERWRKGTITRARMSSLEAVSEALGITVGDLVMG